MKRKSIEISFSNENNHVKMGLTLFSFEEDNVFFVYSPALDVIGYGNDLKEAEVSFQLTLDEFLRYTNNKKTFNDELKRLGWVVGSNKKRKIKAPSMSELLRDNEYLADIIKNPTHKVEERDVLIPV